MWSQLLQLIFLLCANLYLAASFIKLLTSNMKKLSWKSCFSSPFLITLSTTFLIKTSQLINSLPINFSIVRMYFLSVFVCQMWAVNLNIRALTRMREHPSTSATECLFVGTKFSGHRVCYLPYCPHLLYTHTASITFFCGFLFL